MSGFADFERAIEPQPTPGQDGRRVRLVQPRLGLPPSQSASDLTAPVPVADAAFFGVFDHADFESSGGDSLFDSDMTFYRHAEQSAADGAHRAPPHRRHERDPAL